MAKPRRRDPRYSTARWQRLRASVIARDGRACSIAGCTTDMGARHATHVDHVVEVRDGADFWDPSNLRVLCKQHHMAKTQAVVAERPAPVSPNL